MVDRTNNSIAAKAQSTPQAVILAYAGIHLSPRFVCFVPFVVKKFSFPHPSPHPPAERINP